MAGLPSAIHGRLASSTQCAARKWSAKRAVRGFIEKKHQNYRTLASRRRAGGGASHDGAPGRRWGRGCGGRGRGGRGGGRGRRDAGRLWGRLHLGALGQRRVGGGGGALGQRVQVGAAGRGRQSVGVRPALSAAAKHAPVPVLRRQLLRLKAALAGVLARHHNLRGPRLRGGSAGGCETASQQGASRGPIPALLRATTPAPCFAC